MGILHDLRSAVRALRAHAGLTLTIVAILAVAIGANAAVFALVDVTLLAPLPFPDDSRLVTVSQTRADSAREPLSIPDYRDLRDGNRSFERLGAAFQWSANLTGGEAERLQGMKASASLFAILRTPAALGRVLVPEDDAGGGRRVAILTHGLWTRRYGSDPAILGSTLVLNGDTYAIVGVLPRGFITPVRDAEVVVPFAMESDPRRTLRDSGFLRVIGRLRPGVTIAQARADLDAIMERLRLDTRRPTPRTWGRRSSNGGGPWPRLSARCCCCCRPRWRWCWWSRARTSPTCCSLPPSAASTSSPFDRQSVGRGAGWYASCRSRR